MRRNRLETNEGDVRHQRTFILMVAVMTTLALAATAAAAPPQGKGKPGPVEGQTCADEFGSSTYVLGTYAETTTGFTLEINEKGWTCIDVDVPAGTWTVSVQSIGSARDVVVRLRDAIPGDDCWEVQPVTEAPTTLTYEGPDSYLDACGESISDSDPALAFTVYASGKGNKPFNSPVLIRVDHPS